VGFGFEAEKPKVGPTGQREEREGDTRAKGDEARAKLAAAAPMKIRSRSIRYNIMSIYNVRESLAVREDGGFLWLGNPTQLYLYTMAFTLQTSMLLSQRNKP
jgi:hypothetical protein